MQYKNAKKIIIDKRKLEVLIRLGCPDAQILQLLKTGKFKKTGDFLIDETLECLADFKEFKNWGGNRTNKISDCNKKKNKGQLDYQVENQIGCQDVDKDKDLNNKYKIFKKTREKDFNLAELTKKRLEQEMLKKYGG